MGKRVTILETKGCSTRWERRSKLPSDNYWVVRGQGSEDSSDVVEVFITKEVVQGLLEVSLQYAPNECIGFLAGRRKSDPLGRYLLVNHFLVARDSKASRSHVELEVDATVSLRKQLLAGTSQADYLGWFHSHPNIGTFFSSVDRANQRQTSSDWYVGIVVDHADHLRPLRVFFGQDSRELEPVMFNNDQSLEDHSSRFVLIKTGAPNAVMSTPRGGNTAPQVVNIPCTQFCRRTNRPSARSSTFGLVLHHFSTAIALLVLAFLVGVVAGGAILVLNLRRSYGDATELDRKTVESLLTHQEILLKQMTVDQELHMLDQSELIEQFLNEAELMTTTCSASSEIRSSDASALSHNQGNRARTP
jgi:proteasome lid subunit RPN8/RPN11